MKRLLSIALANAMLFSLLVPLPSLATEAESPGTASTTQTITFDESSSIQEVDSTASQQESKGEVSLIEGDLADGAIFDLKSPTGTLTMSFTLENNILYYTVSRNGEQIIAKSPTGATIAEFAGATWTVGEVRNRSFQETWSRPWGNSLLVDNDFTEKVVGLVDTTNGYYLDVAFRLYDEGFGIRYELPEDNSITEYNLTADSTTINIMDGVYGWGASLGGGNLTTRTMSSYSGTASNPPFTIEAEDDLWFSVAQANLNHTTDANLKISPVSVDGSYAYSSVVVSGRTGTSTIPNYTTWNTCMINDCQEDLATNELIANLNPPSAIEDESWIDPGLSTWDWRCIGYTADDGFVYGTDTESMIRFIDFAAENGIEHVMIDDNWYEDRKATTMPTTPVDDVDIEYIGEYAQSKGVGLFIYVNDFDMRVDDETYDTQENYDNVAKILETYASWGATGIKHGFMELDGQERGEFTRWLAGLCAEYELMLCQHEPETPWGLEREYPNLIALEYVRGQFDSPNSAQMQGDLLTAVPFLNSLIAPIDRSPGMFDLDDLEGNRDKTTVEVDTTVANQLGQLVSYRAGVTFIEDTPEEYEAKYDLFEFIKSYPATFDETICLTAEMGDYSVIARRNGDNWWLGLLNDENERTLDLSLDFLDEGTYYIRIYGDSEETDYLTNREAYEIITINGVDTSVTDTLSVAMQEGGGGGIWIRTTPFEDTEVTMSADGLSTESSLQFDYAWYTPEADPDVVVVEPTTTTQEIPYYSIIQRFYDADYDGALNSDTHEPLYLSGDENNVAEYFGLDPEIFKVTYEMNGAAATNGPAITTNQRFSINSSAGTQSAAFTIALQDETEIINSIQFDFVNYSNSANITVEAGDTTYIHTSSNLATTGNQITVGSETNVFEGIEFAIDNNELTFYPTTTLGNTLRIKQITIQYGGPAQADNNTEVAITDAGLTFTGEASNVNEAYTYGLLAMPVASYEENYATFDQMLSADANLLSALDSEGAITIGGETVYHAIADDGVATLEVAVTDANYDNGAYDFAYVMYVTDGETILFDDVATQNAQSLAIEALNAGVAGTDATLASAFALVGSSTALADITDSAQYAGGVSAAASAMEGNLPTIDADDNAISYSSTVGVVSSIPANHAAEGEIVSLYTAADEKYALESISVTLDSDGSDVTVDDNAFVMPDEAVTVTASFAEIFIPTETPTFADSDSFDIAGGTQYTAIDAFDVSGAVSGGTPPYSYSVTGPEWLTISDEGVISGVRTSATYETLAMVRVVDAQLETATILLSVGAVDPSTEDFDAYFGGAQVATSLAMDYAWNSELVFDGSGIVELTTDSAETPYYSIIQRFYDKDYTGELNSDTHNPLYLSGDENNVAEYFGLDPDVFKVTYEMNGAVETNGPAITTNQRFSINSSAGTQSAAFTIALQDETRSIESIQFDFVNYSNSANITVEAGDTTYIHTSSNLATTGNQITVGSETNVLEGIEFAIDNNELTFYPTTTLSYTLRIKQITIEYEADAPDLYETAVSTSAVGLSFTGVASNYNSDYTYGLLVIPTADYEENYDSFASLLTADQNLLAQLTTEGAITINGKTVYHEMLDGGVATIKLAVRNEDYNYAAEDFTSIVYGIDGEAISFGDETVTCATDIATTHLSTGDAAGNDVLAIALETLAEDVALTQTSGSDVWNGGVTDQYTALTFAVAPTLAATVSLAVIEASPASDLSTFALILDSTTEMKALYFTLEGAEFQDMTAAEGFSLWELEANRYMLAYGEGTFDLISASNQQAITILVSNPDGAEISISDVIATTDNTQLNATILTATASTLEAFEMFAAYDLNDDGSVNYADIACIVPFFGFPLDADTAKYDVNDSEDIGSNDYLAIYNYMMSI